jgi:adenine deaminase
MQRKRRRMSREGLDNLRRIIAAASGETPPDLVVKGGKVVNVFTSEVIEADVAVAEGFVAGLGSYDGVHNIPAAGRYIVPGFIDGHYHIESSLVWPPELARAVLARGTTGIVADPHEIANVLGKDGIRFMLESSRGLPVDFYFMLPSCVPATEHETAGAELSAGDLYGFRDRDRVLGLAEVMNYPGVVRGVPELLDKIEAFCDRVKDGHAPLLSGNDLNAYVAAGIRSEHECTRLDEAFEKLRLGMHIMLREGSQARNLRDLLPCVTPDTCRRCSLVSDDLHPADLLERGHLDYLVNLAIKGGVSPERAVAMASLNTAEYFRLWERGAVAPGYRADLLILKDIRPVRVETVIKDGRVVYHRGNILDTWKLAPPEGVSPMNIGPYDSSSFAVPVRGSRIRVIGIIPGQILTKSGTVDAPEEGGLCIADDRKDLAKIAVIERHRGTGNIGLGFAQGFGLRRGALASSVAHDSHNIICIGCDDGDMYAAVRTVEEMKGGLAAVAGGTVLARLPLPVAGLMSDRPIGEVATAWKRLQAAAHELGCRIDEPFMILSFLALPVIPELKITDRGLFDAAAFEHVSLFV